MTDHRLTSDAGQFRYPAVQRYLHDLCGEMGDHLDTITSSLSMFLEIGEYSVSQLTLLSSYDKRRYSNNSICPEACCCKFAQPIDRSDFFLCCYGDNTAVLVWYDWHSGGRRSKLLLVPFACLQYCIGREQSSGSHLEASDVVSNFFQISLSFFHPFLKSITGASCPVVGAHLDQKKSFDFPGHIRGCIFRRTMPFCIFVGPSG